MGSHYIVLGIETSCDETAAAVIAIDKKTGKSTIISNVVHSQINEHKDYGGVIPEFAARAHLAYLPTIVKEALTIDQRELDAVCATTGPGRIGGLHVGVCFAKGFARALNIPFIPVNHLEGHALAVGLVAPLSFPFLLLLISGGHTQIVAVHDFQNHEVLGTTLDDSAGEVFDKTAKLMGLPYPGGPQIEILAQQGDPYVFDFPKPLYKQKHCNFSFSGLKTAIRLVYEKSPQKADIAASMQRVVTNIFIDRLTQAFEKVSYKHCVIAGGVAANTYIRMHLKNFLEMKGIELLVPPMNLCTDNAAMIGFVGALNLFYKKPIVDVQTTPKWVLTSS